MRFYLARLVTLLLSVFLLVPTVLSLIFYFFLWALSPVKNFHVNRFLMRATAWCDRYLYALAIDICLRQTERWIMGTRTPRVEEVKE